MPKILRPLTAVVMLLAALHLVGCGGQSLPKAREAAGTVNGLCPVREEPVIDGAYIHFDGQKIGFCCPPCSGDFRKEPETYLAKMRSNRDKFGYVGK